MERYKKHNLEKFQNKDFNSETPYKIAYERVKKIKGFYVHALAYTLINGFLLIRSFNKSLDGTEEFLRWETFFTAIFWGIGLAVHGLSVFGRNIFFSHNWEERKIKEFMEKEKNTKWE